MKRHVISDLADNDDDKSTFLFNSNYTNYLYHHNHIHQQQHANNHSFSVSTDEEDDYAEEDEVRMWNLEEKLISECYNSQFLIPLDAKDFSFNYFLDNGFKNPIVFKKKHGLGLTVPDAENFTVRDVKNLVGSKRVVDVIDVNTQKALTMTMKEWCRYYENDRQNRLLNVISLEFSHTKLDKLVEVPSLVKTIDWVSTVWPSSLIAAHTESTNALDKMKYPKVQKYVLMSVSGCYTDFHIDMSGTSVWYHLLKGEKTFWLIPPTEENLKLYEKWVKSGKQNCQFFADLVSHCQRVVLKEGWTFMLPSGWIHAVYTPRDSIVFGGNFLHNFNIIMQLKIYGIENKIRVPAKFRFPFYLEIIWYVIERHVFRSTGFSYLNEMRNVYDVFVPNRKIVLTAIEYDGFLALYNFLKYMPASKRNVPFNISKPDDLLKHFKNILNPTLKPEIINSPVRLISTEFDDDTNSMNSQDYNQTVKENKARSIKIAKSVKSYLDYVNTDVNNNNASGYAVKQQKTESNSSDGLLNTIFKTTSIKTTQSETTCCRKYNMRKLQRTKGSIKKRLRSSFVMRSNIERRRRIRCRTCEPCVRDDCGDCKYCKDMRKFGGQGISKQCCLKKQCIHPLLPSTTSCMYCLLQIDRFDSDTNTMMYECESCFEIYHAQCFWKQYPNLIDVECVINETLPSSWHCAKCIKNGFFSIDDKQRQQQLQQVEDFDEQYESDEENDKLMGDESENESSCYNESIKSPSIESLTYYEKQILLAEFCEIITHESETFLDNNLDEESKQGNLNSYEPASLINIFSENSNHTSNKLDSIKDPLLLSQNNNSSYVVVQSSYNLSSSENEEDNDEIKESYALRPFDGDNEDDVQQIINEDLLWKPYI